MEKMKKLLMVIILSTFVMLAGQTDANALITFGIDDVEVEIAGYLENITGVRLDDDSWGSGNEKGDLSMCRSTAQVELCVKLSEALQFKGLVRGFLESSFALDSSLNRDPRRWKTGPGEHSYRVCEDLDAREWYFVYTTGSFSATIGRQQIVWGESDALRMSDVINPLDTSWRFLYAPWEDIRIPLRMINLNYALPVTKNYQITEIDVVINPEDFRPNMIAPWGCHWFNPNFGALGINSETNNTVFSRMWHDIPDHNNFQGGFRIASQLDAVEVKLYTYYQRYQNPVATLNFDPTDVLMGLHFEYPKVTTMGATFVYFEKHTETVFRGECGYMVDEPFMGVHSFIPGMPGEDVHKEDTVSFMLGFDRPTFIRWLNPDQSKTFFISGQWFHKQLVDDGDKDKILPGWTGMGEEGKGDHLDVFTLLINTEYYDAVFKPEILVAWDPAGKNGFFKPELSWEPNYTWDLTVGMIWTWGENYNSGVFGNTKEAKEVFASLRFKF